MGNKNTMASTNSRTFWAMWKLKISISLSLTGSVYLILVDKYIKCDTHRQLERRMYVLAKVVLLSYDVYNFSSLLP